MASGEYNPFQSTLAPNMNRVGLFDMRMMSGANRMETPFERGMRTSYGHSLHDSPMLGGLAGMANEPDYSAFTYDPALRQQAISAGVQPLEASQVKQNTLLPNTGFFGNHPRLSSALEGGLYSLAASHGGMTTGESMQGVAEGLIGGHRIQEGLRRQQFARPFESAGMMEGLRDAQAQRNYRNTEADFQAQRAQIEQDKLAVQQERANTHPPVPVEGGVYMYGPGQYHAPTFAQPYQSAEQPGYKFIPGPGRHEPSNITPRTREILATMPGVDPDNPSLEAKQKAHAAALREEVQLAGGKREAQDTADQPFKDRASALAAYRERQKKSSDTQISAKDTTSRSKIKADLAKSKMDAALASGDPNQAFPAPPTDKEVEAEITRRNSQLSADQTADHAAFVNQWGFDPDAPATPPEGKTSSPKRGSTQKTKGTKDDPHVI